MRTWRVLSALALLAAFMLATPIASAADKGSKTKSMVTAQQDDPAPTADPVTWIPSWNGIYVGVHGGAQTGLADLNVTHWGSPVDINGLGFQRDLVGGVDAGATWRIKGTPIVLIAMASYEWGDSPFDVNVAGPGNILHADVSPTWKAGGGVGWLLTNNAMIYGAYQYAAGKLRVSSVAFDPFDRDLHGYNIALGLEVPWTDMLKVGIQYDMTHYDAVSLLDSECYKISSGIETQAVTLRLKLDLTKAFEKAVR